MRPSHEHEREDRVLARGHTAADLVYGYNKLSCTIVAQRQYCDYRGTLGPCR